MEKPATSLGGKDGVAHQEFVKEIPGTIHKSLSARQTTRTLTQIIFIRKEVMKS